jgi:predicted SAM-dependent methyltransferase
MLVLDVGCGNRDWQKWIDPVDAGTHRLVTVVDPVFVESSTVDGITRVSDNIKSFLEKYNGPPFDFIYASRVFEHFSKDDILYILWQMWRSGQNSKLSNKETILKITVPDHEKVMENLVRADYKKDAANFDWWLRNSSYEFFNTDDDPHRSIWTMGLAEYYLGVENLWKILGIRRGIALEPKRDFFMEITALLVKS